MEVEEEVEEVEEVEVERSISFRWHYCTAAAGPPYSVNKTSL